MKTADRIYVYTLLAGVGYWLGGFLMAYQLQKRYFMIGEGVMWGGEKVTLLVLPPYIAGFLIILFTFILHTDFHRSLSKRISHRRNRPDKNMKTGKGDSN